MRIIESTEGAVCNDCGSAEISLYFSRVRCDICGSENIKDEKDNPFIAVFIEDPSDMYQVGLYGPKLQNRRKNNRQYPKMKELRRA
jgi:hypothetical protein